MRTLPTSSELLERFRRAADAAVESRTRPNGTPFRFSWLPTSLPNAFRVASVRLAQRCLWVLDREFRASFLDTAEGDDLDAWAASEAPGFPRKSTTPAVVRMTFTRVSGATSGTLYAGTRVATVATSTTPAVEFVSLADVPVATGQLTAAVDVECTQTGEVGNVDAGTITRLLTPLFGTFTCTNGFKAAGGNPREGDDAYRDRLRQRDARYRRGTPQAVTLGALSVSGVERVTFRDPQTDSSIAAGTFQLVVGDARGIGSQPLADRVSLALADWAAEGASWSVVAAQTLSVIALAAQPSPIPANTVALRFDVTRRRLTGTFDQAAAERDLRVSLRELGEGLAHNAPLHLAQLLSAVIATDPALFRNVAVKALDAGGAVLATVSADWPAAGSAFRWEIPAEVIRFQWSEE